MGIENEDAQFMLLAGFIIAIGLVIATALLSNIIFESNMAGESGADPLKYDIANLVHIMADEMKSAYRNANGTNNITKINNFSREMQNFNANLSKMYAARGEGVNLNLNVSNWNNSRYPNFTENGMPGGAANWVVIENVQGYLSVFKLTNFTPFTTVSGQGFKVYVTDQTTGNFLWFMESPCGVNPLDYVGIKPRVGIELCFQVNPDDINLLTVGTTTAYKFNTSVTGYNYKIEFLNGNQASGTFYLNGTASGKNFTRARDYVLNTTFTLSTSRMRANLTIPVPVPW